MNVLKDIGLKEVIGAMLFLGGLYGSDMKNDADNKLANEKHFNEVNNSITNFKHETNTQVVLIQGQVNETNIRFNYLKNEMEEKFKYYDERCFNKK